MSLMKKIENYFIESKSKDDAGKNFMASETKRTIEIELKEQNTEIQVKIINYIAEQIVKLYRSSDANDRKVSMLLVFELIDLEINDYGLKLQCLKEVTTFTSFPDVSIMVLNASIFIKFVKISFVSSNMFNYEMKKAKKYLLEEQGDRKTYTLILYIECLRSIPAMFFPYLLDSFPGICSCVADSRPIIRDLTLTIIQNCIKIFIPREAKEPEINKCYETLYKVISVYIFPESNKIPQEDILIASLQVLKELIQICSIRTQSKFDDILNSFQESSALRNTKLETQQQHRPLFTSERFLKNATKDEEISLNIILLSSKFCPQLISKHYSTLIDFLFKQLSTKNYQILETIIRLITLLAGFDKAHFTTQLLTTYIKSMINLIKTHKENYSIFFLSISVIISELEMEISTYSANILEIINYSLKDNTDKKKTKIVDPMILACISGLSRYCHSADLSKVYSVMKYILENTMLSQAIMTTLARSSEYIPNYNQLVACLIQRILDILKNTKLLSTGDLKSPHEEEDLNSVILALRTIRILEISDIKIIENLYTSSQFYLSFSHKIVRLEASKTCCQMISSVPPVFLNSSNQSIVDFQKNIKSTLYKLVELGITDAERDIRLYVLTYLFEYNQDQLSQYECLKLLYQGLYDKSIEIRQVVIRLLGGLSTQNPEFIVNLLERYLLECLSALQNNIYNDSNIFHAKNLHAIVTSSPHIAHASMNRVLKLVIPLLTSPGFSDEFLLIIISTVSDLSFFCTSKIIPYIADFIAAIIHLILRPGNINTKERAVDALVTVFGYSGYFTKSSETYHELFNALLSLLKIDSSKSTRKCVINAFGCLGARDPYKLLSGNFQIVETSDTRESELLIKPWHDDLKRKNVCELLQLHSANDKLDEFYSGICLNILLKILSDPSLRAHHSMVVQILQNIYTSNGNRCYQYLSLLMPTYISVVLVTDADMKKIILEQIGKLIQSSKNKPFPYTKELFSLVEDLWVDPVSPISLKSSIVKVIEYLVNIIPDESSAYLSNIVPKIINTIKNCSRDSSGTSEENQFITLILSALQRIAQYLNSLLFSIIPALVSVFDESNQPLPLQILAITTLKTIINIHDSRNYLSIILQALLHAISRPNLQPQILNLLSLLIEKYPKNMRLYFASIRQTLITNKINNAELESSIMIVDESPVCILASDLHFVNKQSISTVLQKRKEDVSDSTSLICTPNIDNLLRAFQATQRVSKEDWIDWLNRITLELVKESSSTIIRYCAVLSQTYASIGRSLFEYSFFSCWKDLSYTSRESLLKCIVQGLELKGMNEVTVPLLNVAEFIEHTDCYQLMIGPQQLAKCAFESSAYVKSLRYTEKFLKTSDDIETLQSLISINIILNNQDAAEGVLKYAVKRNLVDFTLQQKWFEKLHDWDNALAAYEEKIAEKPLDIDLQLGKMRCLEALCDWKRLDCLVLEHWPKSEGENKIEISRMGSYCSIGLGRWACLNKYIEFIPRETFEGSLFRAVENIQCNQLKLAKQFLDDARDFIENELSNVLVESYDRSYRSVIVCQMLTELEEIINYKLFPTLQKSIREQWHMRLINCKRVTYDWQRFLDQRTLVLSPKENIESWLKFSNICRSHGSFSLCDNAFEKLLSEDEIKIFNEGDIPVVHPDLALNYLRYMWSSGKQTKAYSSLNLFVNRILLDPSKYAKSSEYNIDSNFDHTKLLSKCYLQLGLWAVSGALGQENINVARDNFIAATRHNKKSYKAWYAWAKLNYEIVLSYVQDNKIPNLNNSKDQNSECEIVQIKTKETDNFIAKVYVNPAISSFFKCIQLSDTNSFQHTLRLFTLWFEFGEVTEIWEVLNKELKTIKIDNWLQVIPQLIARIDTPKAKVRRMVKNLLTTIGSLHPHAIIYPLMVCSISNENLRRVTAKEVLDIISHKFPGLVEQAIMISNELIRVSILWFEECHLTIEDASRLFFNEKNISGSLELLDTMHLKILNEAETPIEISFLQNYQSLFNEALFYRNRYAASKDLRDLTQAWVVYYQIFKQLAKKLAQIKTIDLRFASPILLRTRDLLLPMPGTYKAHSSVVCIQGVHPYLKVFGSKQKPRKIEIKGSDGNNYEYLLKGHEDLRQDERVMQLFGLLNNILQNNHETFKRNLDIKQYSVTPLSTNSGLIGWVADCDTLDALIKEQRSMQNIHPTIENILTSKYCPNYEYLDFLHKIEVFQMVVESTGDDELANSLWQKSINSEIWFEKRRNFTRSLAVMSMVGYILGLGDRHPSNIMQELSTGRIIHIDFGDCFEVAMKRDKLPEKVPFRLTRMLTKCIEVTGIDGTFKVTSIRVMEVLRENKDSLLAALEAFIYDPLLNWRLLDNKISQGSTNSADSPPSNPESSPEDFSMSIGIHQISSIIGINQFQDQSVERNIYPEILNKKAISVINRIKDKLSGRDFQNEHVITVNSQVELLIDQATSIENLAQSYIGWCPFW